MHRNFGLSPLLPEGMFWDCSSLQELTTPKADYDPENMLHGLAIPEKFCCGCTSLRKVVIPSECFYIANAAFQKCPSLKVFHIYSIMPPKLDDYVFFSEEEISARHRAIESEMTLYVPEGCADILTISERCLIFQASIILTQTYLSMTR